MNHSDNYFYFEGMRFESVQYILEKKTEGQESEPTQDIKLLTAFSKKIDDLSKGDPGRVYASISRAMTIVLEKIKGLIRKE